MFAANFPQSFCCIKHLSHDLGLRSFKIISLISNKAKSLGGANTEVPQEKPPGVTCNQKLVSYLTRESTNS